MEDLPGEKVIATAFKDCLVLSTTRLTVWAKMTYQSVRLEDITYIEYTKKNRPRILQVTGAVCAILFFISIAYKSDPQFSGLMPINVIILLLGMLLYGWLKDKVLVFSSSGGKIFMVADSMNDADIYRFVELTEHAINEVKKDCYMKKLLLIALLFIASLALKAQSRATTWAEYNYLTGGQFNLVLPGHVLRSTNISSSISFMDATRTVTIFEFYRQGSPTPCAVLIQYKKDGSITNICIPDINSGSQMWDAYNNKLAELNDTGNALQAVSYTLGKYLAAH